MTTKRKNQNLWPIFFFLPKKIASLEEIHKKLSEFRGRLTVGHPRFGTVPPSQNISFQETYKRNVVNKGGGTADSSTVKQDWNQE